MTYNNSYVSSTPLVTIGSKSYYFGDIFTESTMSDSCNGTKCYVSCSCKAGWTTLSTSYSTRAAASGAYVAVTAPRKYADGTPTCRKSVSCADYGYVSSISSGYYSDKTYTIKTDGADLTCYKNYGTCTYSCPSGYYTAASSGYYLTSTSKSKTLNQSSNHHNCSATSGTCYTQAQCTYSSNTTGSCPSGYSTSTTSCSSGYTLKTTTVTQTTTYTKNQNVSTCPAKSNTSTTLTCGKCEQGYFTVTFLEGWSGCGDIDNMSYSETASNPACHAIQRMKASDGSFDGNSSHTKIRYQVKKGTTVTFEVAENVNGKMCGILDKSGGWSCSGNSCTKSAIVNSNTTLTALYKCNGGI